LVAPFDDEARLTAEHHDAGYCRGCGWAIRGGSGCGLPGQHDPDAAACRHRDRLRLETLPVKDGRRPYLIAWSQS
jgi:hypothetical protein